MTIFLTVRGKNAPGFTLPFGFEIKLLNPRCTLISNGVLASFFVRHLKKYLRGIIIALSLLSAS